MEATQVLISGLRDQEVVIDIYIHTHTHTTHTQWNITDICVCVYIYTTHTKEYYSVIKDVVAATWMDLEGIMLSETNQTEKDKYVYV